jgi:hypothetical protein
MALVFAILGAVLATLATQVGLISGAGRALSLPAALALAIVPVIRGARLGKDRIENWTRARSASEALKAETYLYLTGTLPYDNEDRDGELLKQTDRLLGQVRDLAGETMGMPDNDRPLPDVQDIDSYLRVGVRPKSTSTMSRRRLGSSGCPCSAASSSRSAYWRRCLARSRQQCG